MKTLFHTTNGIGSTYVHKDTAVNVVNNNERSINNMPDLDQLKKNYDAKRLEKGFESISNYIFQNPGEQTQEWFGSNKEYIVGNIGDALTTTKDTLINKAQRLTTAESIAYNFLSGFGTSEKETSTIGQFFNWIWSFGIADSPIGASIYMAVYQIPGIQKMLDKAAIENGSLDELNIFKNYFGRNMNKAGKIGRAHV